MSKKIARCSLYVLGMACLTVQAAEPLTSLDKPEGRLDIIAWPGYIERGQTRQTVRLGESVRKGHRLPG